MSEQLRQHDWEELSAYLDGELPSESAERVRRKLEADPAFAEALRELQALDARLDAWTPPEAPAELPERIIAAAGRQKTRVLTWPRVLAGAAAAAAVLLIAIGVGRHLLPTTPQAEREVAVESDEAAEPTEPAEMTEREIDEFAVENLGFFKDYEVLTDFETLEAIERIERSRSSGT